MKWLNITAVFVLMTLVKSGPTRNEKAQDPGTEIQISKILRNSVSEFQCTLSEATTGTKRVNLVIQSSVGEQNFEATEDEPLITYTFLGDLKSEAAGPDVSFFLTARDGSETQLAHAEHIFKIFPEFQDPLTATRLDDPRKPTEAVILRVEGSLGSFKLDKAGDLITEKDKIHYYIEKQSPDYTLCMDVNDVTVSICDITLDHGDLTSATHDEILTSAILSYGSDNQAKVKLEAETPSGATQVYEAILMPPKEEDNALCTLDGASPKECPIQWSNPSKDTLQLIIIRKTPDTKLPEADLWTTSSVVIHDRQLVVNQLGANIIEGRWLVLGDETSKDHSVKSIYRMRKNSDDKVDDIEVDCTNLSIEPKLCFGYFSELTTTKTYTLTVAYKKDGTANEKDQIESSPVTIQPPEPELAILSRHTTRHANQLMADVNICFEHLTPTEGRSFSHYEMLIINEKGQWLKHRIMEEEEEAREGRLCFTPFAINTKDFDLTEGTRVIVSQRGVDGFTVLATGESKLL